MRAVVDCCGRELLTSHGLRSLSPKEPGYIGHYAGDARSSAMPPTTWAPSGPGCWGPSPGLTTACTAMRALAQSFLEPMAQHLNSACMGSVSEIFDGDAPHSARGCFAQAWSVAEILRSWIYLERKISKN